MCVLCRRESEARQVAVSGFLHLLRSSSTTPAGDDTSSSSQLQGEIAGFLRRCLSQQPEVRQMLYGELYGIFLTGIANYLRCIFRLFACCLFACPS